jgi:hypothetical protein
VFEARVRRGDSKFQRRLNHFVHVHALALQRFAFPNPDFPAPVSTRPQVPSVLAIGVLKDERTDYLAFT